MRNLNKFLIIPYLLWMIIFIIIPVLLLVYFSFIDINGHFSFTNYHKFFNEIFKNDVGFYFFMRHL